jgi:hypothetical protein
MHRQHTLPPYNVPPHELVASEAVSGEPGARAPVGARPDGAQASRSAAAGLDAAGVPPLFASFFQGGFECSTHREQDGRRLDVIRATGHDRLAARDYAMLRSVGIRTVRDGLRWHLIERSAGRYDWDSFLPMLEAAAEQDMQVIWDLLHFGWPDLHDVWSSDFPQRFADFAAAAVELMKARTGRAPFVTPVNEISFLSWAGGDLAIFHPMGRGRGAELKRQLARAAILATKAVRAVDAAARISHTDPVINVVGRSGEPETDAVARQHTEVQFEAWDMIAGRLCPELGGAPELLDVLGVNYYCHNQWIVDGPPLPWGTATEGYVPPATLFERVHRRYGRPLYVAETGIEAEARPAWLAYVCGEVAAAIRNGVPIGGVCLYPVMNHPGWADDRHCPNGLIDYDPDTMRRWFEQPLLDELERQKAAFGVAPAAP